MLKITKGKIYTVDLKADGNLQGKKRPCIVLSVNGNISTIIPLTSKLKRLDLYSHVVVQTTDNKGKIYDSMCLLEQIQTVNNSSIKSFYGNINNNGKELITNRLSKILAF